jgi:hypothetical protein
MNYFLLYIYDNGQEWIMNISMIKNVYLIKLATCYFINGN